MSSSMRWRRALTGRSTEERDIGSSFQDEGNSMLKPRLCLAQDSMENTLPCQQQQSREAGSCMGAFRPAGVDGYCSLMGQWRKLFGCRRFSGACVLCALVRRLIG